MEQLMKFKVKKEQISDGEDEVKQQEIKLLDVKKEVQEMNVKEEQSDEEIVQQQQFNNRPDVKAETPAEYLLIIPPEEYPEQAATFKCDYEDCNYVGRTKTNLEIHQNTHTKPFECSYCDKRFGTNEMLTNHELVQHEDPNAFQCHICKKNLTSKKNLKRHIQTHQAAKPFECPKCLKKFRAKHLLNLHQRNMHSGNQFIELVAPICSSMSFISDAKSFICDLCPAKCANRSQIRKHVEIHKKEKKFKCKVCAKSFTEKKPLNEHMATRHRLGVLVLLKCDLCEVEHFSANAMQKHKHFVHSKLALKCDKCDYVAKHPALLKTHQLVHKEWTEADVVECVKCHKKYPNKQSLENHIRYAHTERQFKCDLFNCSFVAKRSTDLKRHQATHDKQFECNICERKFSRKNYLEAHIMTKHQNVDLFKCHVCDKQLGSKVTLRHHLKLHEKNVTKNFNCQQCTKSFRHKVSLKQHQLNVHGK